MAPYTVFVESSEPTSHQAEAGVLPYCGAAIVRACCIHGYWKWEETTKYSFGSCAFRARRLALIKQILYDFTLEYILLRENPMALVSTGFA